MNTNDSSNTTTSNTSTDQKNLDTRPSYVSITQNNDKPTGNAKTEKKYAGLATLANNASDAYAKFLGGKYTDAYRTYIQAMIDLDGKDDVISIGRSLFRLIAILITNEPKENYVMRDIDYSILYEMGNGIDDKVDEISVGNASFVRFEIYRDYINNGRGLASIIRELDYYVRNTSLYIVNSDYNIIINLINSIYRKKTEGELEYAIQRLLENKKLLKSEYNKSRQPSRDHTNLLERVRKYGRDEVQEVKTFKPEELMKMQYQEVAKTAKQYTQKGFDFVDEMLVKYYVENVVGNTQARPLIALATKQLVEDGVLQYMPRGRALYIVDSVNIDKTSPDTYEIETVKTNKYVYEWIKRHIDRVQMYKLNNQKISQWEKYSIEASILNILVFLDSDYRNTYIGNMLYTLREEYEKLILYSTLAYHLSDIKYADKNAVTKHLREVLPEITAEQKILIFNFIETPIKDTYDQIVKAFSDKKIKNGDTLTKDPVKNIYNETTNTSDAKTKNENFEPINLIEDGDDDDAGNGGDDNSQQSDDGPPDVHDFFSDSKENLDAKKMPEGLNNATKPILLPFYDNESIYNHMVYVVTQIESGTETTKLDISKSVKVDRFILSPNEFVFDNKSIPISIKQQEMSPVPIPKGIRYEKIWIWRITDDIFLGLCELTHNKKEDMKESGKNTESYKYIFLKIQRRVPERNINTPRGTRIQYIWKYSIKYAQILKEDEDKNRESEKKKVEDGEFGMGDTSSDKDRGSEKKKVEDGGNRMENTGNNTPNLNKSGNTDDSTKIQLEGEANGKDETDVVQSNKTNELTKKTPSNTIDYFIGRRKALRKKNDTQQPKFWQNSNSNEMLRTETTSVYDMPDW